MQSIAMLHHLQLAAIVYIAMHAGGRWTILTNELSNQT